MRVDFRLQARRLHSVDQPPIENGFVQVVDGRVTEIGRQKTPSSQAIDLGAATIIPGLINAHTHLEFSDLQQPLGEPGLPFTRWIKQVVSWRSQSANRHDARSKAIASGIGESRNCGVIAIGEIATAPADVRDYGQAQPITVFLERLGRDSNQIESTTAFCESWLNSFPAGIACVPGISPHAPYSVHPQLLEGLIGQSQRNRCPLAMHLAETPEEIQLISDQSGEFVELLKELDAWFPESFPRGIRILDYLKQLSQAHRVVIVHGNYLTQDDITFAAAHADRMSIVYCPRTHYFFRHEPYPLAAFLAAGINVAVGTDSRASNPDLNLFEELKWIANRFPQLPSDTILNMGTRAGARALGLHDQLATIQIGSPANFNVVRGDQEQLFGPGSDCQPIDRVLSQR